MFVSGVRWSWSRGWRRLIVRFRCGILVRVSLIMDLLRIRMRLVLLLVRFGFRLGVIRLVLR